VFIPANEREATAAAPAILRVLSEKDMAGFLEQRERERRRRGGGGGGRGKEKK
jgi:hypothetical protein